MTHPTLPPAQPELDLEHPSPLDAEMRVVFETRWAAWHRCSSYEEAIKDPVTRRLLEQTVLHAPRPGTPRRRRMKPRPGRPTEPAAA